MLSTASGRLVGLVGVLVQLFADLHRGQLLRHHLLHGHRSSDERSNQIVAAKRPPSHHPKQVNGGGLSSEVVHLRGASVVSEYP